MKRFKPAILGLAIILPPLLVAAVWVMSYWRADFFETNYSTGVIIFASEHGSLTFCHCDPLQANPGSVIRHSSSPASDELAPGRYLIGFCYLDTTIPGSRIQAWGVSYAWILALSFFPTYLLFCHRRRLRKRRQAGCCLQCGYDLRASPNRCPECGTPVGATALAGGG